MGLKSGGRCRAPEVGAGLRFGVVLELVLKIGGKAAFGNREWGAQRCVRGGGVGGGVM